MVQQNVTRLGGGAGGSIREDLANFISNIDRDETPMISAMGSTKATSTYHDWLTDSYADPIAQTVAEGAAFTLSGGSAAAGTEATATNRTRLRNFSQIFRAQIEVSNTAIAVNTAGIANEFAYQLKKKGVEVRRNGEYQAVLYSADSVKDETGSVRRMGGLASWVGSGNAINAATAGTPTTTYTTPGTGASIPAFTGTAAAFSRGLVEQAVTAMYVNGGKPNMLMTSARRRTAVSAEFGTDTTTGAASIRRLESMEKKLNISIAAVMTDFGVDLGIVPNYVMDHANSAGVSDVMYIYDTAMVKKAVLRPMKVGKLDDRGDGKQALITEECTIEVMNPNAVGLIGRMSA